MNVSLDLGLSRCRATLVDGSVDLCGYATLPLSELREIKPGFIYKVLEGGRVFRVDYFDSSLNRYYKLKPVGEDKPPTLEINGVQMHRVIDTDPWRDAMAKVRELGSLKGRTVLDICTGLGYTASLEARYGASKVVTVEIDRNVLEIARLNPWSRGLGEQGIEVINGDILDLLPELKDGSFDRVLHDPPRINVAGELYSRELYREIYRILKPGGVLFHYTGEPSKHGNVSYIKGIKNRLLASGFKRVVWSDRAKGFVAFK